MFASASARRRAAASISPSAGRQRERPAQPDGGGHGLEQVVDRVGADGAEHHVAVSRDHRGEAHLPLGLVRDERLVVLRAHQVVELGGVGERHLDHPAGAVRVAVDRLGRAVERRR